MIIDIATSLLFLIGLGIFFAALMVIAEGTILNYGDCTISINNGEKKLSVKGGSTLLAGLAGHDIFIPSACGGRGSCAYCKLVVSEGAGPISPIEEPYLTPAERSAGIRLSCQVKVRSDLSIEIPRTLFSVKRYQARVVHKKPLTHDIIELRLKLVEPASIEFIAGQYVQLESQEYKGRDPVMRAYSLSSVPSLRDHIELIVRRVPDGICTTWVFDHLREGALVNFSGPYGDFHLQPTNAPIIFIAGGSGMAPIWSMARDMQEKNITRPATYFFGALTQQDLFFVKELSALSAAMPSFRFIPALSKEPANSGWTGQQGLITDVVARHMPDTSQHEAYLCGSPGMIDACIKTLSSCGMPPDKIHFDKF